MIDQNGVGLCTLYRLFVLCNFFHIFGSNFLLHKLEIVLFNTNKYIAERMNCLLPYLITTIPTVGHWSQVNLYSISVERDMLWYQDRFFGHWLLWNSILHILHHTTKAKCYFQQFEMRGGGGLTCEKRKFTFLKKTRKNYTELATCRLSTFLGRCINITARATI